MCYLCYMKKKAEWKDLTGTQNKSQQMDGVK